MLPPLHRCLRHVAPQSPSRSVIRTSPAPVRRPSAVPATPPHSWIALLASSPNNNERRRPEERVRRPSPAQPPLPQHGSLVKRPRPDENVRTPNPAVTLSPP